jgi:high affinity choline transporter 7
MPIDESESAMASTDEHTPQGESTTVQGVKWGVFATIVVLSIGYIIVVDTDIQWGGFIAMLVFYAIFYYIGAVTAGKRSGTLEDTMVAGRSLPLWIAALTMTATWVGGGYIAGTAESVYSFGLAWAQAPWGYALSLIIGGIFFAPKMRRGEFMTMIDPIDIRFGKNTAGVLYLPALLGEVFWSAAILTALGTTFGTIIGLDFQSSIILSAAVAIAYTVVGGMYSVAYTDVIQVGLIIVGLFVVLPFAAGEVGGFGPAWEAYRAEMGSVAHLFPPLTGWDHPDWGAYYWNWWDFALLLIFGGIPWQVYFQRVLSAKDENTARWLSIAAGFLAMVAAIPAVMIGVIALNVDWASVGAPPLDNPALVLPYALRYLTPPVLGAIGLGAVAAAVMSSVDSSILSASSMGGWNVYRRMIRPQASDDQVKKVIQRLIVIVGVAATLMALNIQSVYELWFLCSDFVFVMLFPQLTCAMFYRYANRWGAIAGLWVAVILRFGGGEPALGLPMFLPYPWVEEGVSLFPFRTLAMVCSLVTILVVSYLSRHRCEPVPLEMLEPQHREYHKLSVAPDAT